MIINRGRYEFRCTPELHDAIKWAAYRRHISVNAYITSVMELAVKADIEAEEKRQTVNITSEQISHAPESDGQ